MQIIDSRQFSARGDFVVSFGTKLHEVDTYVFGTTLIALSEALQAINSLTSLGGEIEIHLEAVGPGSLLAKLKIIASTPSGKFVLSAAAAVSVSILSAILYDLYIREHIVDDSEPKIIINDDSTVIDYGNSKVIVPKGAEKYFKNARDAASVTQPVARVMETLQMDKSIESFGFASDMSSKELVLEIPSQSFSSIHAAICAPLEATNERNAIERVVVTVIKPVLERSSNKWQFIWRGVRIMAPILDDSFFDKLANREIAFAQGDSMEVMLKIKQQKHELTGAWENKVYEVLEVLDFNPAPKDVFLPLK